MAEVTNLIKFGCGLAAGFWPFLTGALIVTLVAVTLHEAGPHAKSRIEDRIGKGKHQE